MTNREEQSSLFLPFFTEVPPHGLSYPNDGYQEVAVDLNDHLVKEPASTYFVRVSGKSMVNAGIMDRALLIVDRDRPPKHDDIVIAQLDGELTCKILDTRAQVLRAANLNYKPISVKDCSQVVVLGVVTHAINPLCSE